MTIQSFWPNISLTYTIWGLWKTCIKTTSWKSNKILETSNLLVNAGFFWQHYRKGQKWKFLYLRVFAFLELSFWSFGLSFSVFRIEFLQNFWVFSKYFRNLPKNAIILHNLLIFRSYLGKNGIRMPHSLSNCMKKHSFCTKFRVNLRF